MSSLPDVATASGLIPFHNREASVRELTAICSRVSSQLSAVLLALLRDTPDPDSAVVLLSRLLDREAAVTLIESHPFLVHYAVAVFGHSRYLGETLVQDFGVLEALSRARSLDRSVSREDFQRALDGFKSHSATDDLATLLAAFKRREYVRILLRDVLNLAPLAETAAEISALSDVLIENALRHAYAALQHKFGSSREPSDGEGTNKISFAVLSLGKLGGNELNYSSDIDLLFLYGAVAAPVSAVLSNQEYFIRLAQHVVDILSRVTPQGPVFRIDLRLRPEGTQGELAVSLPYAASYYAQVAQDWERQALIKIRHSAGDPTLSKAFIRAIEPYVYTEDINFAAIKTALASREKIRRSQSPQGSRIDVKLGPGGIRDIEFLVQCLQRVYGGKEPWLRSGGTLFSLQKLYDKNHLAGRDFHELNQAYVFLRHVEHRLQLRFGQQTHRIPADAHEQSILARSMAQVSTGEGVQNIAALAAQSMAAVSAIYQRIIFQQSRLSRRPGETTLQFENDPTLKADAQRDVPGTPSGLSDLPFPAGLTQHGRRNFQRFVDAAAGSSRSYSLVRENPDALARAAAIFESSDYLSDILVRHPEELVVLNDLPSIPSREGAGYLFGSQLGLGAASADPVFQYIAESTAPYTEKLALLRRHFRKRTFASGARDLAELREVYRSLSVTTSAVEDAIAASWHISGSPAGVAIFGLGRLGTTEFDVLSDADLLFVCEESVDRDEMKRALEQFIHTLSAYTKDGMVCAVDTRLRPHGREGELLTTPTQLESYFGREAQPWEALMYTKLRFLAGSRPLADRVVQAIRVLLERYAADLHFSAQAHEMRLRMEATNRNWKLGRGGIYDIDFVVSYLLVKHRIEDLTGTLRDRIWRCAASGLLDKRDSRVLDHAAEMIRTVDHAGRLVTGRPLKWLPQSERARETVERITGGILGRSFSRGLEPELDDVLPEVRSIYARVLAAPA